MRVFWIAVPKTLENCQKKKIRSGVPFYLSCTNIVYSLLPDCTTDTFWDCSERKECSKILKIPKKSLRKSAFSSNATALQSRISDISKCRLQEKCFLWVFWNSWLTKRFLKNLFPHFWENVGKIAVMKVLENYQKNIFHSVPFKKFELSDPPTYNYAKNYVCSEKLQNCWGSVCGGITF